jgi:serine protease Do
MAGLVEAEDSAIEVQVNNGVVRVLSVAESESAPPFGSAWFSETGTLISEEGHVVTNSELASRTDSIVAILADGRRYVGTLVGSDSFSNLAVYKLPGLEEAPSPRAITDDVRDGDVVYAVVATADGMRQTVKAQVLNARRLINRHESPVLPYIEIEDNNLGTPIRGGIFDERAALVGFVTLHTGPEQKTQVVDAIPIDDVLRIAYELRVSGRVRRSRIGVAVSSVSNELSAARGFAEPTGALIGDVSKGSPADRAGLVVGDIILKVDSTLISTVIRSPNDYQVAMERIRAGSRIQLEVLGVAGERLVSLITGEVSRGPPVGEPGVDPRKSLRRD